MQKNITALAVTLALIVTYIIYTEYVNPQDSFAESQQLYEAQTSIPDKSTTFAYGKIEKKDKISLSEMFFSE